MRPLPALERFFEQLFERPAVRIFRPRIQPVQLQRRIERAMENERMSGADRTLVPNRFRVHLHPEDLDSFGNLIPTLATDLAEGALVFARTHRYTLIDRPRVDLVADPGVGRGEIRVQARFAERTRDAGSGDDGVVRGPRDGFHIAPDPRDEALAHGGGVDGQLLTAEPSAQAYPAAVSAAEALPSYAAASSTPGDDDMADGGPGDLDEGSPVLVAADASAARNIGRTMVFEVPKIDAPLARLREVRPNGTQREIELDGGPLTIGRATDNGLVIHDSRVSRHHARLQARRGTLVFTDLRSTNGSRVNGSRVAEVVLGEGDRIEIGDTVLVVESVASR
jgi:hypothetical protein